MGFFVPLLWAGGAIYTAYTAKKISDDVTDRREIEQENYRIEDRRLERFERLSPEQVASVTPGLGDNFILLLRRLAFPLILVFSVLVFLAIAIFRGRD